MQDKNNYQIQKNDIEPKYQDIEIIDFDASIEKMKEITNKKEKRINQLTEMFNFLGDQVFNMLDLEQNFPHDEEIISLKKSYDEFYNKLFALISKK